MISDRTSEALTPKHLIELGNSCIAPDVAALNFRSIEGPVIYDYLCYSEELERLNAGRLVVLVVLRIQYELVRLRIAVQPSEVQSGEFAFLATGVVVNPVAALLFIFSLKTGKAGRNLLT